MAVSTKIIQGRISSVKNTRKITKAMELVAAAKMRKASTRVVMSRPYAKTAWEIISSIAGDTEKKHPLLAKPEKIEKILLLIIASDRGLCGGFNSQLVKESAKFLKSLDEGVEAEVIACGKYAERAMRKLGKKVIAYFTDLANNPTYKDIRPVGKMVIDEFISGNYDKVAIAFTDFISPIQQVPKVMQLLPLEPIEGLGEIGADNVAEEKIAAVEYLFEPSARKVLEIMLPKLVEAQVYQAILESAASEHSARMVAMKNASESATEMINDLTFTFNQARQASITKEILEISSGKAALENIKN